MDKTMDQEFLPRNEFEMCGFFEDLLFMKTEKFLDEDASEFNRFKLSNKKIKMLADAGILNRIFRRWYQTTWGMDNWSSHFEGETPRQELTKIYPEIGRGEMFFATRLVCEKDKWKVEPAIFSKKLLNESSLFLSGLRQAKTQEGLLFEPHFDPDFKQFTEWLFESEKIAQKLKSYSPPKSEEEKYWRLFWEQAGANLAFNCRLKLAKPNLLALSAILQDCLTEFFSSQKEGSDNFLSTDELFVKLWDILRKSDQKLLPLDEITEEKLEKDLGKRKDKPFIYSMEVFYYLGVIFDELILFPIEWYFGGAEIVWTDKMNFLQDLMATDAIFGNDFDLSEMEREIENEEFPDIRDSELNLSRLWFAPCTSFRLTDPIRQYFK